MSVFFKTIASLSILGLSACAHFHADTPSTKDYSAEEEVDVFDPTELVEELERVIEQADEAERIIEYYGEAEDVTEGMAEMGIEIEDLGVVEEN